MEHPLFSPNSESGECNHMERHIRKFQAVVNWYMNFQFKWSRNLNSVLGKSVWKYNIITTIDVDSLPALKLLNMTQLLYSKPDLKFLRLNCIIILIALALLKVVLQVSSTALLHSTPVVYFCVLLMPKNDPWDCLPQQYDMQRTDRSLQNSCTNNIAF